MKHVCAAVIRENGKILVSRRLDCGKWEFPGGKIEPGETERDCIRRELREETGLHVKALDILFDFVHVYPAGAVHLIFLRCIRENRSEEPRPMEGQPLEWAPIKDIAGMDFLDADRPIAALFASEA